jgi:hypothetical protein
MLSTLVRKLNRGAATAGKIKSQSMTFPDHHEGARSAVKQAVSSVFASARPMGDRTFAKENRRSFSLDSESAQKTGNATTT